MKFSIPAACLAAHLEGAGTLFLKGSAIVYSNVETPKENSHATVCLLKAVSDLDWWSFNERAMFNIHDNPDGCGKELFIDAFNRVVPLQIDGTWTPLGEDVLDRAMEAALAEAEGKASEILGEIEERADVEVDSVSINASQSDMAHAALRASISASLEWFLSEAEIVAAHRRKNSEG